MNMTDYAETRRTFRLNVPEDFEFARDVVDAWAARAPGKVALVAVDQAGEDRREHTFLDIARASNRVANGLAALGVRPGERAFVMLPAHPGLVRAAARHVQGGRDPDARRRCCSRRATSSYRIAHAEATLAVVDAGGRRSGCSRCATGCRRCAT